MKTIIEAIRMTIAVGMGILASFAIGILGLLIYDKNRGFVGILITALVGLLAIYVGYQVYKTARRRGILEFSAAVHTSPDMDNLEPSGNSEVRRVNIREYVGFVNNGEDLFKGGYLRIWGDWKGRDLEQIHSIKEARYVNSENLFQIIFQDESQVSVWNPQIITESPTYLKILKAGKVRWEWKSSNHSDKSYYDYFRENKRIRTETNTDWKDDPIDVLLGEPALLIIKKKQTIGNNSSCCTTH
ncbi:hypothetical protein D770_05060 [Flammeovirgaceae bacterium 311]|nr:hypothetical protein D770_05060 [Flammeovirgaceae bacterium 311]